MDDKLEFLTNCSIMALLGVCVFSLVGLIINPSAFVLYYIAFNVVVAFTGIMTFISDKHSKKMAREREVLERLNGVSEFDNIPTQKIVGENPNN